MRAKASTTSRKAQSPMLPGVTRQPVLTGVSLCDRFLSMGAYCRVSANG